MTVLREPTHELMVGDRAPNFVLPAANGKFLMFYDQTKGLQPVLVFTPGGGGGTGRQRCLASIRRQYTRFSGPGTYSVLR